MLKQIIKHNLWLWQFFVTWKSAQKLALILCWQCWIFRSTSWAWQGIWQTSSKSLKFIGLSTKASSSGSESFFVNPNESFHNKRCIRNPDLSLYICEYHYIFWSILRVSFIIWRAFALKFLSSSKSIANNRFAACGKLELRTIEMKVFFWTFLSQYVRGPVYYIW